MNSLPTNYFVIITGPPASGKTSLGIKLVTELKLPFIFKDGIKELLFDSLGWKDRDWSKNLVLQVCPSFIISSKPIYKPTHQ